MLQHIKICFFYAAITNPTRTKALWIFTGLIISNLDTRLPFTTSFKIGKSKLPRTQEIHLNDRIVTNGNLWGAFKKVKENGGAPGVNGITVHELKSHLRKYFEPLKKQLKDGTYRRPESEASGTKRPVGTEINPTHWQLVNS
ncbi:hypothetical protein ACIQ7N_16450 [Lysinibacillus sp. NPDC095746]|uniref:hypothetical protein n=1 Tax=Lysinibacillus sp. NPDC095746 TaxID=3364134 RepID=UPI003820D0F4